MPRTRFIQLRKNQEPVYIPDCKGTAVFLKYPDEGGSVLVISETGCDLKEDLSKIFSRLDAFDIPLDIRYISNEDSDDIPRSAIEAVSGQAKVIRGKICKGSFDLLADTEAVKIRENNPESEVKAKVKAKTEPAQRVPAAKAVRGKKKFRVLIVDDSKTIRMLLRRAIESMGEFEVAGEVENPRILERVIREVEPDVITLDINMPHRNGCEILRDIRPVFKIPVLVISALTPVEGSKVLEALELGATDYIQKPNFGEIDAFKQTLNEKLKITCSQSAVFQEPRKKTSSGNLSFDMKKIIGIGASTGGTDAIKKLLSTFPPEIPPVVIVQHIPPDFSQAFADRLNQQLPYRVSEAKNGDLLEKNKVLIAPGSCHMKVTLETDGALRACLDNGPPVSGHKPSVDFLFLSLAEIRGRYRPTGVILTGMGVDGAKGMLKMKQSGSFTVAQDKASCVVYGMPKSAVEMGGVHKEKDLYEIAYAISESKDGS